MWCAKSPVLMGPCAYHRLRCLKEAASASSLTTPRREKCPFERFTMTHIFIELPSWLICFLMVVVAMMILFLGDETYCNPPQTKPIKYSPRAICQVWIDALVPQASCSAHRVHFVQLRQPSKSVQWVSTATVAATDQEYALLEHARKKGWTTPARCSLHLVSFLPQYFSLHLSQSG